MEFTDKTSMDLSCMPVDIWLHRYSVAAFQFIVIIFKSKVISKCKNKCLIVDQCSLKFSQRCSVTMKNVSSRPPRLIRFQTLAWKKSRILMTLIHSMKTKLCTIRPIHYSMVLYYTVFSFTSQYAQLVCNFRWREVSKHVSVLRQSWDYFSDFVLVYRSCISR